MTYESKEQRLLNKQVKSIKNLVYATFTITTNTTGTIVDINEYGNPVVNWSNGQQGIIFSSDVEVLE